MLLFMAVSVILFLVAGNETMSNNYKIAYYEMFFSWMFLMAAFATYAIIKIQERK